MISGQSIVLIAIHLVISILIFLIVGWLLPELAHLVGFTIPGNIVTAIALLLALLYLAGGWVGGWYRRGPVV